MSTTKKPAPFFMLTEKVFDEKPAAQTPQAPSPGADARATAIPLWKKLYKKAEAEVHHSSPETEAPEDAAPVPASLEQVSACHIKTKVQSEAALEEKSRLILQLQTELEHSKATVESLNAEKTKETAKAETDLAIRLMEKQQRRTLMEEREVLQNRVNSFEEDMNAIKQRLETEKSLRIQTAAQSAGKDAVGKGLHKRGNTQAVRAYRELLQESEKHCDKCLMMLTPKDTGTVCSWCQLMSSCRRCPAKEVCEDVMRERPRMRTISASLTQTLDLPPEYTYIPTVHDCPDCAQYCRFCNIKFRDPPQSWVAFSICDACAKL